MWDEVDTLFTITDLKQYIYCPRIFYYHACLPYIRPITYNMRAGIEAHQAEEERAKRRSLRMYNEIGGDRYFDVAVRAATLGLSGKIDEVVDTGTELIPVDYKLASKAAFHYKVQLAAYALLLEESRIVIVRRGFLHLIPLRRTQEIKITPRLRSCTHDAVENMHHIQATEQMPGPTEYRRRCSDCEFRRFCNDV
jgi:CRISPR-associated exonuclease Cas4